MQHETLELRARRYAPVRYMGNGNKLVLPAESFAIGDILITPPNELYIQLKAWQEFRKNPPSDLNRLLFRLKNSYMVQVHERAENEKYKTRKACLLDLSPAELRFALLRKLFAEKDSYNLWNFGHDSVREAYAGEGVLTGDVKSMERGGRGNQTYHSVNVTNPFGLPVEYHCLCEDSRWTDAKEGGTGIDGACAHAAALQVYAYNSPGLVKKSDNALSALASGKEFFLPFHFRKPQQHDLRRRGIEREVLKYISAQSPDLSHLKMDVLVGHLFNKTTYFKIGKKLLLIPDIYDPILLEDVFNGKVFYETVMHEKMKVSGDEQKFLDMDAMVRKMMSLLTQRGYELKGHPLEFRDSRWETVSWHYEKGNEIVRIVPNAKFPPVFVYRKKSNGPINPFLLEDYRGDYHPFGNLFGEEQRLDDRTKQVTSFEVRIPTGIEMPQSVREMYREAISQNFEGGIDGVISRVKQRSMAKGIKLERSLAH